MTTITYQQKCDPVFNSYGYITGYDTIKDVSVNVADDKTDAFLVSLAENETVYNVKVYQTLEQQMKSSGEFVLDPEYWNEPY